MNVNLLDRLFAEEFTDRHRAAFRDILARGSTGRHEHNFNLFDLLLTSTTTRSLSRMSSRLILR